MAQQAESEGHRLLLSMGHTPDDAAWKVLSGQPEDRATYKALSAAFSRNLRGLPVYKSQYGYNYETITAYCPKAFEEALGTEKAKMVLLQEGRAKCSALAKDYPVAVWRMWPDVTRTSDGELGLVARLHVMTEDRYQQFVQQERD